MVDVIFTHVVVKRLPILDESAVQMIEHLLGLRHISLRCSVEVTHANSDVTVLSPVSSSMFSNLFGRSSAPVKVDPAVHPIMHMQGRLGDAVGLLYAC